MKNSKKVLVLFLFIFGLSINLFANNQKDFRKNHSFENSSASEVFLMPDDGNYLKEKLRYEILSSRETIFLAMYNFSYKSIAKDLIKASKQGVKITILLDKEKVEDDSEIYDMLKDANIDVRTVDDRKMHLKMMLFDKKLAMIGSLNFTKKSFEENFDFVYFSKDYKLLEKLKEFVAKFE